MHLLGFSPGDGKRGAEVFITLLKKQGLKPCGCPRFAARLKPYPDTGLPTSEKG
jgi:hypothetical protein